MAWHCEKKDGEWGSTALPDPVRGRPVLGRGRGKSGWPEGNSIGISQEEVPFYVEQRADPSISAHQQSPGTGMTKGPNVPLSLFFYEPTSTQPQPLTASPGDCCGWMEDFNPIAGKTCYSKSKGGGVHNFDKKTIFGRSIFIKNKIMLHRVMVVFVFFPYIFFVLATTFPP